MSWHNLTVFDCVWVIFLPLNLPERCSMLIMSLRGQLEYILTHFLLSWRLTSVMSEDGTLICKYWDRKTGQPQCCSIQRTGRILETSYQGEVIFILFILHICELVKQEKTERYTLTETTPDRNQQTADFKYILERTFLSNTYRTFDPRV